MAERLERCFQDPLLLICDVSHRGVSQRRRLPVSLNGRAPRVCIGVSARGLPRSFEPSSGFFSPSLSCTLAGIDRLMKRERASPYATIALEHPRTMRLICARATRARSESILTEDVAARMRGLIASPGTVPLLMTPVIADYHLPDGTARPIADRGRFSLDVYPRARLCRGRENLAIDLPTRTLL